MFYIFRKIVDGRRFDRYFKSFDNAEEEMERDVERVENLFKVKEKSSLRKFNHEKGWYECEDYIVTSDGTRFLFALINGHFED